MDQITKTKLAVGGTLAVAVTGLVTGLVLKLKKAKQPIIVTEDKTLTSVAAATSTTEQAADIAAVAATTIDTAIQLYSGEFVAVYDKLFEMNRKLLESSIELLNKDIERWNIDTANYKSVYDKLHAKKLKTGPWERIWNPISAPQLDAETASAKAAYEAQLAASTLAIKDINKQITAVEKQKLSDEKWFTANRQKVLDMYCNYRVNMPKSNATELVTQYVNTQGVAT